MRLTASERSALGASAAFLVLALAGVAMFIPPLVAQTVATPLRATAAGLVLAAAMLLHWAFLGIAARRMQRSLLGWLALSVLLFPVGSAMALILLSWYGDDEARQQAA
jgi:drug/metabolite transporter (DMT)-like permease